jgi:hypothetical protein
MVFYSLSDLHLKCEKMTHVQHKESLRRRKSTNRERKQQFVLNQNFIAFKKVVHTKKNRKKLTIMFE